MGRLCFIFERIWKDLWAPGVLFWKSPLVAFFKNVKESWGPDVLFFEQYEKTLETLINILIFLKELVESSGDIAFCLWICKALGDSWCFLFERWHNLTTHSLPFFLRRWKNFGCVLSLKNSKMWGLLKCLKNFRGPWCVFF